MNKIILKSLLFLGTFFISNLTFCQEVPVLESLKTVPNSKCYWSYSVERVSTTYDTIHKYIIRVRLEQQDSSGIFRSRLRVKHALIYCSFNEKGISQKIYFKQKGKQWIANFKISTNQPLPLEIVANYNNQQTSMPLTLNKGTYPGEPDG